MPKIPELEIYCHTHKDWAKCTDIENVQIDAWFKEGYMRDPEGAAKILQEMLDGGHTMREQNCDCPGPHVFRIIK
jgi:hypothetical protein